MKPRFWEAHGSLTMGPCPSCGAEFRYPSRHDPRGACSVRGDSWYCFECKAKGFLDALKVELTKEQRTLASAPRQTLSSEKAQRFWGFCTAISPNSDVKTYLDERFGRTDYEVPSELARRLPDFALETDAIKGWTRSRFHLIVPLVDEDNLIRNFVGRSVAKKPKIKSMSLRGYARKGQLMKHYTGLDSPLGSRTVFTEGELDFLAWSIFGPEETIVFGIQSGATKSLHVRGLRNCDVLIATDLDEAGEEYAGQLRRALHESNRISRWDPGMDKVEDACDVLKSGGKLLWV